jgi:homoserine O-succinyltransferase
VETAAPIVIGLVNGMPGEARRRTEQQFRGILAMAAGDRMVDLQLFSLGAPPPTGPGRSCYRDIAMLDAAVLDGLIVTGMPPQAAALTDEPYWPRLTELVDFAIEHAVPTVWSCLAAHAAVLYLDGVERRRLPEKLSGLIDCTRIDTGHPITDGLPGQWRLPHSRYNEVPEDALRAHGYRILSRSAASGADIFVKEAWARQAGTRQAGPLFLFCQGHPEYDADTLLREYRRDVGQFLAGGRGAYPALPQSYFSPHAVALLTEFRARTEVHPTVADAAASLADFPLAACAAGLSHSWHALAIGLYDNWLTHLAERRMVRSEAALAGAVAGRRGTDAPLVLATDAG